MPSCVDVADCFCSQLPVTPVKNTLYLIPAGWRVKNSLNKMYFIVGLEVLFLVLQYQIYMGRELSESVLRTEDPKQGKTDPSY